MEPILSWFSDHHEVAGFLTTAFIYIITVFLASRKLIGFWITLLFLIFALLSGLAIANQDFLKSWMMKEKNPSSKAPADSSNAEESKESIPFHKHGS